MIEINTLIEIKITQEQAAILLRALDSFCDAGPRRYRFKSKKAKSLRKDLADQAIKNPFQQDPCEECGYQPDPCEPPAGGCPRCGHWWFK